MDPAVARLAMESVVAESQSGVMSEVEPFRPSASPLGPHPRAQVRVHRLTAVATRVVPQVRVLAQTVRARWLLAKWTALDASVSRPAELLELVEPLELPAGSRWARPG